MRAATSTMCLELFFFNWLRYDSCYSCTIFTWCFFSYPKFQRVAFWHLRNRTKKFNLRIIHVDWYQQCGQQKNNNNNNNRKHVVPIVSTRLLSFPPNSLVTNGISLICIFCGFFFFRNSLFWFSLSLPFQHNRVNSHLANIRWEPES